MERIIEKRTYPLSPVPAGFKTAKQIVEAIAESTAEPPLCKIPIPILEHSCESLATPPCPVGPFFRKVSIKTPAVSDNAKRAQPATINLKPSWGEHLFLRAGSSSAAPCHKNA